MTTLHTVERIDPGDDLLGWAREILEGPGAAVRLRLRAGWTMLGIRLHRGARDAIAGWPITHHDREYVRVQSNSPIGLSGELITRMAGDRVEFATLVRLDNPAARLVWARALPTHLGVVRSLMDGAASRVG